MSAIYNFRFEPLPADAQHPLYRLDVNQLNPAKAYLIIPNTRSTGRSCLAMTALEKISFPLNTEAAKKFQKTSYVIDGFQFWITEIPREQADLIERVGKLYNLKINTNQDQVICGPSKTSSLIHRFQLPQTPQVYTFSEKQDEAEPLSLVQQGKEWIHIQKFGSWLENEVKEELGL